MREFYNEDCMEGMKRYPDKFFDLAIVDPPYGDGNTLTEGGAVEPIRAEVRQVQDAINSRRIAENRTEHGVIRTGGTWARKYAKKSFRGMLPQNRNTSQNCFASHGTRLSGGAITSIFHRLDAF